ncbi:MAG: glycosyltransferase family 4 protein [Methylacidiphilales bacterium]|nr:glycosyltransferase family 4 protein [Candidatus Methylacidiphilales bacterium]
MKIALLTSDNRELFREYDKEVPWFGTAPEALLQGFAQCPSIEVHVVSCTQRPMKSPAKLAENTFFHSLHVPKIGWLRTGYQGCIRAVRRLLREIRPDIVHGQGTERDCAISAAFSGYPNVVTIHGKMTEIAELHRSPIGSFYWCASRVENFTLPRAGGIICISDYMKNLVERYGVPVWPIPNALRQTFFDFPRTSQHRDVPLILNVGVISERKRQRQILDLLCSLRNEGADFETLFVGESDPGSRYAAAFMDELAAAQNSHGGFSHVGRLGVEDCCRLFDTASAMLHFARQETFGLVSAEALTRNLHLFASDVGGIREIASDVPGVEIFHHDDWGEVKDAVRIWIRTRGFECVKPDKAPEGLVRRYHPASIARQHVQVYEERLSRQ